MDVTFLKGIASMSGTVSRYRDGRKLIARTYKRTGKTTFHVFDPHKRSTRVSASEQASRSNFGTIASKVARRMSNGDKRPRTIIWHEVASELNAN